MAQSSDVPSLGRLDVAWYNAPLSGTLSNDSSNNKANNNDHNSNTITATTTTSANIANGTAAASSSYVQKSAGAMDVDTAAATDEGMTSNSNADAMKQPAIAVPEVDYDVADDDDRWMAT